MNKLILKLFGAVLDYQTNGDFVVDSTNGLVITPNAAYAKKDIISFYEENRLNGNDLNKTFHKSWSTVINSTREELAIHQIIHYLSTYGNAFDGYIYIPDEKLDVPHLDGVKFLVIKSLSKDEVTNRAVELLNSGIALKDETINDVLSLLDTLGYKFTDTSFIKNKEAMIKIIKKTKVMPRDPVEMLRYAVFLATESTLLIKNQYTIDLIIDSKTHVSTIFNQVGYSTMATIFNRFKPLFLAFKKAHKSNVKAINKISKLSKHNHKPLTVNALNRATQERIQQDDLHWLENATVFALFKALNAVHVRLQGQDCFAYKIRNGKSYFKEKSNETSNPVLKHNYGLISNETSNLVLKHNYGLILDELKGRVQGGGKTIFVPDFIEYGLPTSEKLFVGNYPFGTKVIADKIAAGIYWRNEWGATDIDLSGVSSLGKCGWNSEYDNSLVTYSGDQTNAFDGATEYLYAKNDQIREPLLVFGNIYAGDPNSTFKIIVGFGDNVDYDYMMNPNNLVLEAKTESAKKQSIIGLFLPVENGLNSFVLLNVGTSGSQVSMNNDASKLFTEALVQEYTYQLSFNKLLNELGFNIIHNKDDVETVDYDFSPEKIDRDTFISIFKQ